MTLILAADFPVIVTIIVDSSFVFGTYKNIFFVVEVCKK